MTSPAIVRRMPVLADYPMARPALVYLALFAAVGSWYPFQAVLLSSRGLDLVAIGLLLALSGIVALVAAPVWGAAADRLGRVSPLLVAASVVAGTGAAWMAVARDPASIAAALAVMAFGTGGMIPLVDTRTLEIAGANRDRYALARAFGSASFIGGAIVTGVVISGRSPDALFVLYVPLLFVTGLAAWRLLGGASSPGRVRQTSFSVSGFVRVLGRPGLRALLVGTTVIWTAVGAVMAFIAIHVTAMGADLAVVGLISAVGAIVEIPIMLAFPKLSRRFGAARLLVLGAFAFALRALLWGLAPTAVVALVVAPLGGVGFALFYVGLVAFVSAAVPREAQATAQGVFSGMTFSLGTVVGSALAGVLAPALGLPGLFIVSAVATAIGALVVARAVRVVRPVGAVVSPDLAAAALAQRHAGQGVRPG